MPGDQKGCEFLGGHREVMRALDSQEWVEWSEGSQATSDGYPLSSDPEAGRGDRRALSIQEAPTEQEGAAFLEEH